MTREAPQRPLTAIFAIQMQAHLQMRCKRAQRICKCARAFADSLARGAGKGQAGAAAAWLGGRAQQRHFHFNLKVNFNFNFNFKFPLVSVVQSTCLVFT